MRKTLHSTIFTLLVCLMLPALARAQTNTTIAGWNFDFSGGSNTGITGNTGVNITGTGQSSSAFYSSIGCTGGEAICNGWSSGDRWQSAAFKTTGATNLTYSFKHSSFSNGPRNFKFQYSLNGSTWVNLISSYTIPISNGCSSWYTASNVSLPSALENQSTVYLRWETSSSGNGGNRLDEVYIKGDVGGNLSASISAQTNVSCGGTNDGAATVTVSGGTANYTYVWSSGSTTSNSSSASNTVTGLAVGTYTVTITDGSSCTETKSVTISKQSSPVVLSASSQTNIACNGGATGAAAVSAASGGTAPYTYNWTPGNPTGDGTTSVTGLSAGTWTCTVTDANGCTKSQNFTITQPAALVLTPASQTNIACNAGSTGAATVNAATGGSAPYTYNWTPGNPTGDGSTSVSGLTAGTWTCTVTDANGCTKSQNFTITQPAALSASVSIDSNVSCNGANDGGLTANVSGGSYPYTYLWNNMATTASMTGLSAGNYTVTVTDANGCTTLASGTVTEPAALSAVVMVDSNVSCNGGHDGGLTVGVSGGTAPYTYMWNNMATTASITGLSAGNYSVAITDANGCTETANGTITEPTILSATATTSDVSCNGDSDGSIDITVTGGTAPYTFNWGGGVTTEDRTAIPAGNYSVTITDANGCSTSANSTVGEPDMLLSKDTAVASGSVTINGNWGGWLDDASGIVESNPSTFVFAGVTSNTDHVGWNKFDISSIPDNATITSVTLELYCNRANGTGTINIDINDISGVYGPYNSINPGAYADFNNGTYTTIPVTLAGYYSNIDLGPQAAADLQSRLAGDEFQIALDANGNSDWKRFTSNLSKITVNYGSTATIVQEICPGSTPATINQLDTVNGGSGNYAYLWQSSSDYGTSWINAPGVNTLLDYIPTVALFDTTYYRRMVIDQSCGDSAFSDIVKVHVPDSLELDSAITNVSCNGGSDGVIDLTVIGGAAPYTYAWSNTATTEDINGLSAGTYSVTVTDKFGCTISKSFTVYEPALLVANIALDSNESCTGAFDGGLTASATGGTMPYSYAWSNGAGTATIKGIKAGNYSVTITDSNGCTATENHTVIMEDLTSPTVSVQNINAYLDATGNVTVTANQVDNGSNDFCGLDTLILDNYSFNCSDIGANTVWFKAIDINGNMDSATAIVTVIDTVAPKVLTSGVTVYLDAVGQASIALNDIENGSTDACGIASSALSQYNFDCSHVGSNTVMLSVTDIHGNIGTANATVTVLDTISPKARVKNVTAYLNANGIATVNAADVDNGSSDICNFSLSLSQTSFDCTETGLNLKTFTITDGSGNKASKDVLITVKDTISPTLRLKKMLTVTLDQFGNASISASQLDSASTDNCSNLLFFSVNKTSFNCSDLGNNQVVVTAFDNKNNSTSGIATVKVVDYLAPVVNTRNISAYLDASGIVTVAASAVNNSTTDNCAVDSLWLDKSTFGCANLGQNVVRLYAKDKSGNVAQANAVITVVDTISPVVLTKNATIYLNINGVATISAASLNNGSTDNCALQSMSLNKTTFGCADLGTNTVVLTVMDAHGNGTSANATVTVIDTISPVVVIQNITVALDASGNAIITPAMVNNGSTDACGIQSMSLDVISFTCANLGANTVTLSVTDNHSNVSAKTATVTVVDNVKPVVATKNITIYLDANGDANIVPADIDNGSTDNCGISGYSLDISVFDCADLGQNLVILTATDASNNSASKSAFVTVLDTINPSIDNMPANITVYAPANQCAANVQWPAITGSDNCNVAAITTSKANGAVFPLGTTTVNVTATDGSGNFVAQTFDITVLDTVAPMVSNVPSNYTVAPNANSCDALVNWIEPVAIDNCGGITWTKSHIPGSTFPVGNTTVTYTATDAQNNATTVSFVVTVNDVVAPVISSVPANINVNADAGSCNAVVNYTMPTVFDNCSGASIVSSHPSGSTFALGATVVTFTATDAANNVSIAKFTVTVTDREKPMVTSMPASDTVGSCGATYTFAMPTATDNCSGVTVTQIAGLSSGSIFPTGVTVNAFRISDANGSDTTVSFSVVVVPQGMPNLPTVLEICEHMPAVEMTLGQNMNWTGKGIVANGTTFDPAVAAPGRHKLDYTFVDRMGCSVSGSIYVTVLPRPAKPVIAKIGSTTLSTGNFVTYQWYRDGIAIPGATSQNLNYTVGGNYQVMVTNASGCDNFSDGVVIGQGKGGIGIEEELFGNLDLYPNPSNGLITIDLNREQVESIEITVYNTAGKQVFAQTEHTSTEGKTRIDLSNLPDATYLVHIKSGNETAVKRVVLY